MILSSSKEIFNIKEGVLISKRNLFDVIQFSKVPESPYYDGTDFVIGNTLQQGIKLDQVGRENPCGYHQNPSWLI